MNQAENMIRTMSREGLSAGRIADVLYDRGLKNGLGRPYTPSMIEGFMRYTGLDEEQLVAAASNHVARAPLATEPAPARVSPYSKEADPIAEPLPKVRMLKPWPADTDFSPDNLGVRN